MLISQHFITKRRIIKYTAIAPIHQGNECFNTVLQPILPPYFNELIKPSLPNITVNPILPKKGVGSWGVGIRGVVCPFTKA